MSHGMNFIDVMKKLPFKQTGLGTEDCHPRFIGCLLRLGDLFDLDDNRFCPVMAKHVSNIPSISKHHHDKHLSLREFQLDKRIVKLVAECPDEMSYVETQNWFGWIRKEFQNQMSQWNLIVPDFNFGSLPTIEQLDVQMEVKYEAGLKKEKILLNNEPMKFTIDERNAMEILQGANLYKNKLSIFRELIQNSIDATMLKIYLCEIKNKIEDVSPIDNRIHDLFEKNEITISLCKRESVDDTEIWSLEIKDQGIGISIEDLTYMQKMAGSSKNLKKIKIIQEMPKWMRPSGEFGIGLQSIFLLTNSLPQKYQIVSYKTKNIFTNDYLEITMNSPLGEKSGYCFISKLNNEFIDYGTNIKVHFSVSKDDFFDNELYLSRKNIYVENYELRSKLIIWEIYKKLLKIASSSIVNIKIETDLDEDFTKFSNYQKYFYRRGLSYLEKNFDFSKERIWCNEYNIFFKINILDIKEYNRSHTFNDVVQLLFKGQIASTRDNYISVYDNDLFNFFSFEFDFYGINAKEVLNINRDSWKSDFVHEIYVKFFNILKNVYENNFLELSKMLKGGLYLRLFEYFIGKINFKEIFLDEDIRELFGIDFDLNRILFLQGKGLNLLKSDVNYIDIYNRNDCLQDLLKKYLSNKGFLIYSIFDGEKSMGQICIQPLFKIEEILVEQYSFSEIKPWGNNLDFEQSIISAFKPKFHLFSECYFYLYINLSNIEGDFDKEFYDLRLSEQNHENRILLPFYIYKNKLVRADLKDFINFLLNRKLLLLDLSMEKILKIYKKLNIEIEAVMKNTEIWKTQNEIDENIKFIDE